MIYHRVFNIYIRLTLLTLIPSITLAARIIEGDAVDKETTFQFVADKHYTTKQGNRWIAARADQGDKKKVNECSLSVLGPKSDFFIPACPEKVTLGSVKSLSHFDNPLFDAGIDHFVIMESNQSTSLDHPIVVPNKTPSTIYAIMTYGAAKNPTIECFGPAPDAHAHISPKITALGANNSYVLAAVAPAHNAKFGTSGTGIAYGIINYEEFKVKNKDGAEETQRVMHAGYFTHRTLTKKTRITEQETEDNKKDAKPTAYPLDITSSIVKIGNDLAQLSCVSDIHWDAEIGRFYITLHAQANSGAHDGVQALLIGEMNKNTLKLYPAAPPEAFDTQHDYCIGARGSSVAVSLHKVRTMKTTTRLNYVICLGGIGTPQETKRRVCALPVTSLLSGEQQGTIASTKDGIQESLYSKSKLIRFRRFTKRACQPQAMPTYADDAVCVGAGKYLPGDIENLYVSGDTVYVIIPQADTGKQPGIFKSQALFDGTIIKGWTAWQPYTVTRSQAHDIDHPVGMFFDENTTSGLPFIYDNEKDPQKTYIKKLEWGKGDVLGMQTLTGHINHEFSDAKGGINTLSRHSISTQNKTLLAVGGQRKILLAMTGRDTAKGWMPYGNQDHTYNRQYNNGMVKTNEELSPHVITLQDKQLEKLGSITAIETITVQSQDYLLVGGSCGVALLTMDNKGLDIKRLFEKNTHRLPQNIKFASFGSYTAVRKLIIDNNFLYILTDSQLDRIDLEKSNLALNQLEIVTLADVRALSDDFATLRDVVISQKFALLASCNGLYRVGNGADIRFASDPHSVDWTHISLPKSTNTQPQEFFVVSPTGKSQDVATHALGGNIYVLSTGYGKRVSRLYRMSVNNISTSEIDNSTIQFFSDHLRKGAQSYFMSFNTGKNHFALDGSVYLFAQSTHKEVPACLRLISHMQHPMLYTGTLHLGHATVSVPIDIDNSVSFSSLIQQKDYGSWMIAGDFGIRVLD